MASLGQEGRIARQSTWQITIHLFLHMLAVPSPIIRNYNRSGFQVHDEWIQRNNRMNTFVTGPSRLTHC
jgi:hypothetical protein